MVWDGECWDETAGAFKRGTGGPASRQEQPRVVLAAATPPATMRRAKALVMQAAGPRPADGIGPLTVGRNSPNWPAFDAITAKLAEVLRG